MTADQPPDAEIAATLGSDLRFVNLRTIDVPVVNGVAVLPDGRTVRSDANVVRILILDESAPAALPAEEE